MDSYCKFLHADARGFRTPIYGSRDTRGVDTAARQRANGRTNIQYQGDNHKLLGALHKPVVHRPHYAHDSRMLAVRRIPWARDMCVLHRSQTHRFCKILRKNSAVVLSGVGGGNVFYGAFERPGARRKPARKTRRFRGPLPHGGKRAAVAHRNCRYPKPRSPRDKTRRASELPRIRLHRSESLRFGGSADRRISAKNLSRSV